MNSFYLLQFETRLFISFFNISKKPHPSFSPLYRVFRIGKTESEQKQIQQLKKQPLYIKPDDATKTPPPQNSTMASFKTTKKHHKHINNPFPSKPKTLSFTQETLIFDLESIPSQKIYEIGHDFQLNWSSNKGGSLSISHKSNPSRSIWATVPGRAFVSAAVADTEVEESRGSFLIKDKNVRLVCNHQTVEDIRIIQDFDYQDSGPGKERARSPVVQIKGRIFTVKEGKKRAQNSIENGSLQLVEKKLCTCAKYWMLFDQKNSDQVGFQVRFGKPDSGRAPKFSSRSYGYRGLARKIGRIRRLRFSWCGYLTRKGVVIAISPSEEENVVMKSASFPEFNRICVTYSSEKSERFYGFGEQFSHMDLKGKRVPIFVQEQGIGRGDQPITFAANLVSYR